MNGQHDMYTRMEQVIEYINSEQPHQVDIDILAKSWHESSTLSTYIH